MGQGPEGLSEKTSGPHSASSEATAGATETGNVCATREDTSQVVNEDRAPSWRKQQLGKAWASEPNNTWFYVQSYRDQGQPQETGWTSLDPHVVTVEMDTAARRPQAAARVTNVPV